MPAPIESHHASHSPYKNKIVSAAEAVALIHDGDTVATGGFVGIGFAEAIVSFAQDFNGIFAIFWVDQPASSAGFHDAFVWASHVHINT